MTLTPDIYFTEVPKVIDMTIRSELVFNNEFTFAVAVILSAQATDKKVNEITPALFAIADTPQKMLHLGDSCPDRAEMELKKYIRQISFFNNKAKNIISLAAALAKHGNSKYDDVWKFPEIYHNRAELMQLPGIGQKTANVIMNVLWGAPTIGVDTHVFRNAHRYGWVSKLAKTPEKVESELLKTIPTKYHAIVNHVMVLHGRHICKALRPKCDICPVAKWCTAKENFTKES